ncbi:non-ribosomal peptide synthetase [Paraburkholderia bannensis]|uniref:non-ribosomal peptide synthetase n=1 Tax=Paraburkholderia bannensis TaxID=765414 RepID=UPI002AB699C4|nr:non-ribosomal peptide synthetase [Paraburkholderia bannensis]
MQPNDDLMQQETTQDSQQEAQHNAPVFTAQDWKSRIIKGRACGADAQPPAWLDASYATLREQVMHPAYPCFFGTQAERRGEMFYSFVNGKDIADLPATMQTFAELASLPQYRKNNIAVFFEPDVTPLSHDEYHDLFWHALQQLHNVDPHPEADQQPEPSDESWEFSFAGVEMFVVCACPSFSLRHSRNLGPGMVLLFQPRSVFVDTITNKVIGREARNQVRKRLETWDDTPAHPDLGFFGDPGNLEWKQYFLDDHNVRAADVCPFLKRKAREAGVRPLAARREREPETEPQPAAAMSPSSSTPAADFAAIARNYASLGADKRATFRARLRERGLSGKALPIVPLADRTQRFALSPAQERLWFLWQLNPEDAGYNIAGALRLEGALDVERLRAALDHVVARHEALRTHFEESDGQVEQVVGGVNYAWSEIDLRDAAARELNQPVEQRLQALSLAPFDLTRGPLLRIALLREANVNAANAPNTSNASSEQPASHILHVALHHIVADHASVKLLLDEFVAAYGELAAGRTPAMTPLAVQYGDFAAWQQEWADDGERDAALHYWTEQLGDTPAALDLPVTKACGGIRNVPGARASVDLDAATTHALKALAAARRTTLPTLLLAAYALLLARYTGQQDVRIGMPVSGRNRLETEPLIGFFVNTLVIRADLNGAPSFAALLDRLHQTVLDAHRHDSLPFAQLVEALHPERNAGQTPLFQVMFNHTRAQRVAFDVAGLQVSEMAAELPTARFDLVLNAIEREDGVRLAFNYAADRFEPEIIEQMLGHLARLLAQAGRVMEQPLAQVALVDDTANAQASAHAHDAAAFDAVGARFSRRAAAQPQAQAVHCEGEQLSYGELERWSTRIAARLRALGVAADQRIGLCVERSAALVAGVLGVLKSGAAFVPLDPAYPLERLADMLDDADIGCVIADATGAARLGALLQGRTRIDIAALAGDASDQGEASESIAQPIHPEQLAYVIYTSGSTGKPKGVAINHGTLARHLDDFIGTYAIDAQDKQLQSSTINFDVALHEMLPALLMGGQIEMRGAQLWGPETTSQHLIEQKVTFARIPTAYWQQWLREPPPAAALAALRQITVGGEGLPGDALRQWRSGPLGHIRLDNLYGPTETTIACMYRETRAQDEAQAIVSIGGPYPSRSVRVCDAHGNEAPVGALGELCIGGLTLARGYLGRAALTAERFVPDPHGAPGSRLYRTGDLCRRRLDGSIDFLGRLDQQVKLRGYRIELGEIEAVLREAPGVEAAAAALRGEGDAKRLVGYVVGEADDMAVRRLLQSRLPGYMVPSALVWLDHLPTMQNGKLDRAALPEPGQDAARRRTAPRNATETTLLAIWQAVLGRDDLGVTDNFFDVGGHSLLMMRVAARVREALGRAVSLRTLFLNPVLADLAAELDASVDASFEADTATSRDGGAIVARAPDTRIPLTEGQERLWFLWKLDSASAAYTISGAVALTGALDRAAVRRALDALVARHETLRTRFEEQAGEAWQHVDAAGTYDWREEQLAHAGEIGARLQALTRLPFDLERGPMLRVTLLTYAQQDTRHADETVLHFAMPHIVSDAWSQATLLREFAQGYAAALRGAAPTFAPLPVQFGDYAIWQRARRAEQGSEQIDYWLRELGGDATGNAHAAQPLLALPADRTRSGARSTIGATLRRTLDPALALALDTLSREQGATRFMTLLAAFGSLLQGYSGQQDVRVGVPVAGRDRLETEPLIGFFVNTLVIRMATPRHAPFSALLAEVRERMAGAHAHADVPFATLVERLQPQRSVAHTPLFQAMFNYVEESAAAHDAPFTLPGLTVRTLAGTAAAAQVDLALDVAAQGGSLKLSLTYASDIFESATVERLFDSYIGVLQQIAQERETRSPALLDDAERARLLALGRNARRFAQAASAHRLIERQAATTPHAVALQCGDAALTYAELDARANRLAHRLLKLGVAQEAKVGVCVERSTDMVAALLAVHKAGAAYVPLDPSLPAARRAFVLADSGVSLLITESHLADADADAGTESPGADAQPSIPRLELDRVDLSAESAYRPLVDVTGDQLAYAIYTSGSTGTPKGVMVTHRALGHFLLSMREAPGLCADDVLVAVTSLSFDIAALELFLPLTVGARVVIAPRDTVRDGAALARLVETSGATALQSTPAGWRLLRAGGWPSQKPSRRFKALCGGEALQADLARDLLALGGDVQLWNLYGPTETTIWSAAGRVTDAAPVIGAPIAATQLYVLDANLDLAPANVAGELYIGGVGLARGYLGRAGLSAAQFVPNPFDAAGARLYRTGDLAKWRGDGRLEYLGRADHQVKIRGFRIEPGEIEAQLLAHDDVREAIVIALDPAPGSAEGARLVAYVAPHEHSTTDAVAFGEALRERLARVLPDYMVPSAVVVLDRLPLNTSGKVDRHALPAPAAAAYAWEAPQGETETLLAQVWQTLLRVERVGRCDHFFALGGQSLLALRMTAALREAWRCEVPVRLVFATPVLADLARELNALRGDTHQAADGEASAIPARPVGMDAVPLSDAQARLWFFARLNPHSAAYNLPGAVRLEGVLDRAAVQGALAALVARHESLRTRFVEVDGEPLQRFDAPAPVLSVLDFEDVPPADQAQRVADTLQSISRAPFDLGAGPLLRVTLIRLGERDHLLHVLTHHLISDAWSNQLVLEEFSRAYAAQLDGAHGTQGTSQALAPLPRQYADYALWQRSEAQSARAEADLDFWRTRLGGEHAALELPFDRRPGATRSHAGGRVGVTLAHATAAAVHALARRLDTTSAAVLLAAFDMLLARYSGQRDIRVGVPVTGRDSLDTQRMIGFFVNTLVVRSELDGLADVDALVRHVSERLVEAQAHQQVPFARVVETLSPDRSLTHTPLFSVMFNYDHGTQGDGLSLPGLRASRVETSTGTARFDLVLTARERKHASAHDTALSFTYARDVFDEATAARLLGDYVAMLEQIVAPGQTPLAALQLAPASTDRQISLHTHPFAPVGARITARARTQPHANALHCEGERLSYGELDTWSARIALALQARGAGAEQRIGLCLTRSVGLVAALVGVLRSGAAFVPLDPTYPPERLRTMIEEAQLACVLADAATLDTCGALFADREALDIAALRAVASHDASDEAAPELHAQIHPDQLAYVIYTSGSAGRPKGVAVSHDALSRHLDDFIAAYGIDARDTQLQSSTINFDVALHEMLPALMQGGQVEMRGPQLWDVPTTNRHLKEGRVSFARIPTAYWQQWLRTPPPREDLAALRQVTVGGEGLPGDALTQWRAGPLAHIRLDNLYGPTETTVACMYRETRDADGAQAIVSIGEPYASRCVYVMDRDGNELPVGALGELCIGGLTLARGYLGRPDLTAASFVPDPRRPGARLYRSGDLCRRRADGSIDFLGRLDQQVKLRGFRIELGEIEAVLREAPGVTASAVALHGEGDAKRLVGYVVGEADDATLRRVLESRLPAYMVPSALVRLERLPLMQNGKLDRAALPVPQAGANAAAAAGVAPATPLEARLLRLWQDVLPQGEFGVTDDFFAVGGHSLLALKVLARAREQGLPGLTLEALFQHATVRALAAHMAAEADAHAPGAPSNIVALSTRSDLPRVFALHAVSGLVADYRALAEALDGVASVQGVQAPFYTESWWPGDLAQLAADYAARIRRVQPHGPYRLIGWSVGGLLATEVARALAASGAQVDFVGLIDAYVPHADDAAPDDAFISGEAMKAHRASDAELRALLDGTQRQWALESGIDDAQTRSLLGKVQLFQRHLGHIARTRPDAAAPVDLTLWWANRAPHRPADEAAATWRTRVTGRVVTAGSIDTDHQTIVRHRDLFDALARELAASIAQATWMEATR